VIDGQAAAGSAFPPATETQAAPPPSGSAVDIPGMSDRPRRSGLDRNGGDGGGAADDVAVAVAELEGQGGVKDQDREGWPGLARPRPTR
jgi:hypothetical protein